MPFISRILQNITQHSLLQHTNICMVAASYRGFAIMLYRAYGGYWTSTGRPSQTGLEQDAIAVLEWIRNRSPDRNVTLFSMDIV